MSTCSQIGEQAQGYISQSIDPELGRVVPERNRLKSQLDATNAEIEKAKHRGISVPARLARKSQGLKAQIRSLDGAIAELEQQKRKLADYMRTVNSIRTARQQVHKRLMRKLSATHWPKLTVSQLAARPDSPGDDGAVEFPQV